MSKHTPKPWRISESAEDDCLLIMEQEVGGQVIAQVDPLESQPANASLMAAAPDLLDAVRGLLDGISDLGDHERERFDESKVRAALQAIALATRVESRKSRNWRKSKCPHNNWVGRLIEYCLRVNASAPEFEFDMNGEAHAPTITCTCYCCGLEKYGKGKTKKEAKQAASNAMLDHLEGI